MITARQSNGVGGILNIRDGISKYSAAIDIRIAKMIPIANTDIIADLSFLLLVIYAQSKKKTDPQKGRFHYWLGTGQVAKLRPVLHRAPINSI
jgi:hypothetical protein